MGGGLPPTQPGDSRFFGKGFHPGCDTHLMRVARPDFFAAKAQGAHFTEVVSRQDAQLLPLAMVFFRRIWACRRLRGGACPQAQRRGTVSGGGVVAAAFGTYDLKK